MWDIYSEIMKGMMLEASLGQHFILAEKRPNRSSKQKSNYAKY